MTVNRISTSPTEAAGPLLQIIAGKISSSTTDPPADPNLGPLALLAEATEKSNYLPNEDSSAAPVAQASPKVEDIAADAPIVAAPSTATSETPAETASIEEPTAAPAAQSIPQDVAFSPSRRDDRIPKKTNLPAPIGSLSFDAQLPPGLVLPDSVTPEILAGKPMRMLLELPPKAMGEALAEFDCAVKERGSEIRSLPGYLVGVIKRYRTIQQASRGGVGVLSDRVLARLDRLISSGYCHQTEIDDGIKNKLAMMTENEGLSAIEELCQIDRKDIRNFGSYFMGIMNRYANNRNMINQIASQNSNNRNKRGVNALNKDQRNDGHSGGSDKYSHYGRSGSSRRRSRSRSRSRSRDRDRRRRRHRSYSSSSSRSRSDSRDRHSRRRRRTRSRSGSRDHDRHRDHKRSSRFGSKASHNSIPPPQTMGYVPQQMHMAVPPPPPARAPAPSMHQHERSLNDQQLQQLFQVQPRPPTAANLPRAFPGQPSRPADNPLPITLPSNLSPQQIQALQAILGPSGQPVQSSQPQLAQPWKQQTQPAAWPAPAAASHDVDIFGLAEKAAAALSSVPAIQQNTGFPPPMQHNAQPAKTEQDLSRMVQYALQNLRVSGHVEATLDTHVCNLLAKLPEANALLALETFASCNTSTMRNKTAYLIGILKKELVKIGLS